MKNSILLEILQLPTAHGYPLTFKHPLHNKILTILNSINTGLFIDAQILFGGGTFLTLQYNEYRCSKDIDFICTAGDNYKKLRTSIFNSGYDAIFSNQKNISLPREIMTTRDKILFSVDVDRTIIKFEIICEARIALDSHDKPDWSPVPCLSLVDSFAEKLLANADRWADTSIESRDLIDLCIIRFHNNFPDNAKIKAENAYPVIEPLKRAIKSFQDNPEYRKRCYESLQIKNVKMIIDGLDLLAADFGLCATKRKIQEAGPEDHIN